MKKNYLVFLFALVTYIAQSQCIATTQYPEVTVNSINTGAVQQITDCNFGGEYSVLAGLVPGETYAFTSSNAGDFLTLTDDSNAVLASGASPLVVSAINVANARLHIHASEACATDFECHTTTLQCTSCTPPPAPANDDCSSVTPTTLVNGAAPISFTGTTVGGTASATEATVLEGAAVWEAVTLTGTCNDLKVEYCGTAPGVMDGNVFIVFTDCLTDFTIGEYDFSSCVDGNPTLNFYGLAAGTYYLPVIVDFEFNILGDYLMTVSSIDCPDAPLCASEPIFPADGAVDIEPINDITFTWTAPTSGPAPTSYDFYGGVDANALTLFGNVTETEFVIAAGDYNLLLYWQVVPRNGSAAATGCPVWSFTTAPFEFLGYCLTAVSGQFPMTPVTPAVCDGVTPNLVTDNGWAGEYAVVNVTAGQTYQFVSSAPDLITISYDGTSAEAYGVSQVTWTATADGSVRFYTNLNDDNCGGQTVGRVKTVLCGASLGVEDFELNGLKAYPNPVKNTLNLNAQTIIQNVAVYNMLGQEVLRIAPNSLESQLDMSALNVGTYFVKVTSNDRTATLKVVKQ